MLIIYLLLLSSCLSALHELSVLHLVCLFLFLHVYMSPLLSTLFYCTPLIILSLKTKTRNYELTTND